ncbi:hypothetical protein E1A91_A13G186400v1 [Gossypium mustelinum]|uniref:C2 domain-containing protein n=1 Tax=Gossypium mustelinum TaxID=34275 RepID=A0A5D2WK23_GOSMU|nr:hypothetical protein E1A91_A13G186400v1 [Gossypium mustelinum]
MAENCTRKLIVEICNANNLMPKDGQGTASAYAIVDFAGQRRRTKTKFRDLNPVWDEKLEFLVHDIGSMASEILEINLYNDKKIGKRSNFLGKIKLAGTVFVSAGAESLVYYSLEKRSVFSQVKGEIGVKIFYVDEEAAPTSAEQKEKTAEEKPPEEEKPAEENKEEAPKEEEKPNPPPPESSNPQDAVAASTSETNPAPEEENNQPLANKEEPPTETAKDKAETGKSTELIINNLELRSLSGDHNRMGYDLVDPMPFLYVRVVKAKVANKEPACPLHVFAFDKEGLNSSSLEVSVWTEEGKNEEAPSSLVESCLGTVSFDLQEMPKRVPPDSPLAPQWYSLESESETGNDVMVAVWVGTQADEAFQEAWQSDSGGLIPETRAKVYLSPKLWYLRLTVIQTQDLQLDLVSEAKVRSPEIYVKALLGAQLFKTSRTEVGSAWNEDLVFVAAEPFEPFLVVKVEDASNRQSVGDVKIHVSSIDRRTDDKTEVKSRWFNLIGGENKPYAGRIHVRVCLEGGYHVLDEAAHVTSDVRATAKQLTKPPIGLLDVGIRGANNMLPVKTKDGPCGTTDAYVVAKYGPKWIRTRTILDLFNPRWNEQYTWDVYDPCTVLTIGVFDNGRYKGDKDVSIGKVRIRLSTLDTNKVYRNSYTLTVLSPDGVKKMGEIEIAIRFCCSS